MSTKKYKLKNGMTVLLVENHKSPVVSVQMWVKTGSADEKPAQAGISHFIEHLVFKGTRKFGVGQIASMVEGSGGELNAYTSFDQTVFYVTISKQFVDVGMEVISEMMGFPKFDATEIDNEREVVIEEIKRSNDSPSRQASQLLFSTVFKTHAYGVPVIGYDRIIKKVSRKVLVDYFQSRYVPQNMHLIIAGDFEEKSMRAKIEEKFGAFKKFKLAPIHRKKEKKQTSPRLAIKEIPFEEAQFHLAWQIPGAAHKDIPALDVLALIMGQGDSSPLARKLRLEKPLVNSIGSGTFTPKDSGLFAVSGSLNINSLTEAMDTLLAEMGHFLFEAPASKELAKAITNFEADEFYGLETVDAMARKVGGLENLMGDYKYFEKYLKMVYKLKPEDLVKVARKYLRPDNLSIIFLQKGDSKATKAYLQKWQKEFKKLYSKRAKAKIVLHEKKRIKKIPLKIAPKPEKLAPKIERFGTKGGIQLLVRKSTMTPVLSVKAAVLGGLRLETPQDQGVTELLSRVWTSGTKKRSETEIQLTMDNMAAGLSAFGGRNTAGISLQCLSPFEKDTAEIFWDVLLNPLFDEQILEREKTMMLEALRSRNDNPAQVASLMFSERIFAGHPYAQDTLGNEKSIAALNPETVRAMFDKVVRNGNLFISITGATDKDFWIKAAAKHSNQLKPADALAPLKAPHRLTSDQLAFHTMQKEQSHIILGYQGLSLQDPQRYALQILQSVLAGQGGRLFLELRDKESLAYSVSPMRMEGLAAGYFGAYIGCSPEKGEKAIRMLKEELGKTASTLIPDEELVRAKRYLIGRHDIDLQRASAVGTGLLFNEIYGVPAEEIFTYAEKIRNVTSAEVLKLAQKLFAQPSVTVAVGPRQPW